MQDRYWLSEDHSYHRKLKIHSASQREIECRPVTIVNSRIRDSVLEYIRQSVLMRLKVSFFFLLLSLIDYFMVQTSTQDLFLHCWSRQSHITSFENGSEHSWHLRFVCILYIVRIISIQIRKVHSSCHKTVIRIEKWSQSYSFLHIFLPTPLAHFLHLEAVIGESHWPYASLSP